MEKIRLVNPWSKVACKEMNWPQIRNWAREHIYPSNRENWLKDAYAAYLSGDGATLGEMIIGS